MELVTFGNPNLGTTRSVCYFAKKRFPDIHRVYFIDAGTALATDDRREAVMKYVNTNAEMTARLLSLGDLHREIPELLSERCSLNGGRDRVVVDMTSGTKEMSSVLYAAASLIRIPQLFFLSVERAAQEKLPEAMSPEEVKVRIISPLEGNERIGRAGLFEILYYRDSFEKCLRNIGVGTSRVKSSFLRDNMEKDLYQAIDHYFHENFTDCIRRLGTVSEELGVELARQIKQKAKGDIKENSPKAENAIAWIRVLFTEPLRKSISEDPNDSRKLLKDYQRELRHLATVDAVLDHQRYLRNFASHPYVDFHGKAEAAVALQAMLYLVQMIANSRVLS